MLALLFCMHAARALGAKVGKPLPDSTWAQRGSKYMMKPIDRARQFRWLRVAALFALHVQFVESDRFAFNAVNNGHLINPAFSLVIWSGNFKAQCGRAAACFRAM